MKKALILGVTGMLGHQVYLKFKESKKFSAVKGVAKEKKELLKSYKFYVPGDIYNNIDFLQDGFEILKDIILDYKPEIVVNCVVTKSEKEAKEKIFLINSFLPHFVGRLLDLYNGKLIQISTDGVFNGSKGNYSENDIPDAKDIYGKSKFFGEVGYSNHLTIRTSIFGHEIFGKKGLLEWFISIKKPVYGYKNYYFSGITTNFLAELIIKTIDLDVKGIINIGSKNKISKYNLLNIINKEYNLNKKIIPSKVNKKIDRSLNVNRMISLGIHPSDHRTIIRNMRDESIQWRISCGS